MDRRHRDCVAFLRVCSGRFERDREMIGMAYPGDVVGIVDKGTLHIGDTVSERGGFEHQPLPRFQPEHFARIAPKEHSGRKRFDKGLEQLAAEGTVQRLWPRDGGSSGDPIVAAVGKLQFDVLLYRLRDEYGVETRLTPLPYSCSAWLEGDPKTFQPPVTSMVVRDARERVLVLFGEEWDKRYAIKNNPAHRLLDVA